MANAPLTLGDIALTLRQQSQLLDSLSKRISQTPLGQTPAWTAEEKTVLKVIPQQLKIALHFFDHLEQNNDST